LLFSTSSILKIIKLIKIILKKNHKKIMCGNTVAMHNVLKKKTTKLNSQPAQYKKIKLIKAVLEKNKKIIKKI
jgi:hypothetical protein